MNPLNNLPGVGATAKDPARAKDSARAKDPGTRLAAEAGLRRTTRQIPARCDARAVALLGGLAAQPDPGPP